MLLDYRAIALLIRYNQKEDAQYHFVKYLNDTSLWRRKPPCNSVAVFMLYRFLQDINQSHTLFRDFSIIEPHKPYDFKFKTHAVSVGIEVLLQRN